MRSQRLRGAFLVRGDGGGTTLRVTLVCNSSSPPDNRQSEPHCTTSHGIADLTISVHTMSLVRTTQACRGVYSEITEMASSSLGSSTSFTSSSPPPFCSFYRLPTVLLPLVCSFLSPRQLLLGIARTATTTRDLLTPVCFSFHPLQLRNGAVSVLCDLDLSSRLASATFYSRVLSDCSVFVDLTTAASSRGGASLRGILDALDHITVCGSLTVIGGGRRGIEDGELHALLNHPTTLSCHRLSLDSFQPFTRPVNVLVPVDGEQSLAGLRLAAKRAHHSGKLNRRKLFDWADIHLPALTHLRLHLRNKPRYSGMNTFLTAHIALLELDVTTLLVSVDELAAVFRDPTALPMLARLSLDDPPSLSVEYHHMTPMLTALATTLVGASSRPRPMERLILNLLYNDDVIGAAALMQGLTRLEISSARQGWLEEWTRTHKRFGAFPLLQECVVHTNQRPADQWTNAETGRAVRSISPFLQCLAEQSLQLLDIRFNAVTFDAAALTQLARFDQLRELHLSAVADASPVVVNVTRGGVSASMALPRSVDAGLDKTEPALFTALTPGCFSRLRVIVLHMSLSAEAVVAVARAAPGLRKFESHGALSCQAAVICAIIGGYCEHMEQLHVQDEDRHVWSDVVAADVVIAYESAVAAAGRNSVYRPFTQLYRLYATMCWCAPPSVWHALLSLLKLAAHLQRVEWLSSNDPLVVCSLSHLPSLTALGSQCVWPRSFATFMERKSERTRRYRYVAAHKLQIRQTRDPSPRGAILQLTDQTDILGVQPIRLRARAALFSAFQRSLSVDHQAVLARWEVGDIRAGDEQVRAAESKSEWQASEGAVPEHLLLCPRPQLFWQAISSGLAVERDDSEPDEDIAAEEGANVPGPTQRVIVRAGRTAGDKSVTAIDRRTNTTLNRQPVQPVCTW